MVQSKQNSRLTRRKEDIYETHICLRAVPDSVCLHDSARRAVGNTFSDVPQDHWANPYVEAMTQKGVVTGVGNGRFNPDGNLSTAEFAVMLTQAFCPEAVAGPEEGGAWWEPYLDAAWSAGYHALSQSVSAILMGSGM